MYFSSLANKDQCHEVTGDFPDVKINGIKPAELVSLRTLKIMTRNLNEIIRS
jgi:hypothetical protein